MLIELTLSAGVLCSPKWNPKDDMKKEVPKYCRSKFDELEELKIRLEMEREAEREKLFRLLLEEVQKDI